MPELFGIGIWIASLVFTGAVGWIIGGRRGAMHGAGEGPIILVPATISGGDDALSKPPVPDGCDLGEMPQGAEPREGSVGQNVGDNNSPDAGHIGDRAEIFEGMPTLSTLHAEVDAIRLDGKVWEWPDLGDRITELLDQHDEGSRDSLYQYYASIESISYSWNGQELASDVQPSPSSTRV